MVSAFFHFQQTSNRLFNDCIKLYWYFRYLLEISWDFFLKHERGQFELPLKIPVLLGLIWIFNWTEDFHVWWLYFIFTFKLIPYFLKHWYKRLQHNNIILVYNHIKIFGKRLYEVNYHSAGKKLAKELTVLLRSSWS